MYPFNKTVQFDRVVTVSVGGWNSRIGGVIFIQATKPPEIKSMKEINRKHNLAITKLESNEFYNVDVDFGGEEGIGKEIKDFTGGTTNELIGPTGLFSDTNTMLLTLSIVVIIIVILLKN